MAGIPTNRTSIDLPVEVSNEIMQTVQEESAVMRLASRVALPGNGMSIPVITSDPEASWVGETDKKPVSNPGLDTKIMRGYTIAVIVPFSNQFRRDRRQLYDAIVGRLPKALGKKFDETVFGNGSAPGSDFDTFAEISKQSLASDVYGGLVAADTDIAIHGGILNGFAISPQMRGVLLGATDTTHRPIFNDVTEGDVPKLIGAPTYLTRGAFVSGSPATIGIAGDWTKAMYGIVEDVSITESDQATLTLANGTTFNLFEHNMFAIRAEIEVGFRADTSVFNALTHNSVPSI